MMLIYSAVLCALWDPVSQFTRMDPHGGPLGFIPKQPVKIHENEPLVSVGASHQGMEAKGPEKTGSHSYEYREEEEKKRRISQRRRQSSGI